MDKLIAFVVFCITVFTSYSQDIIQTKTGEKMEVKVLTVTDTYVQYKLYDYQDGPTRNMSLSEIDKIIYEDGTEEEINEEEIEKKRKKREESREHVTGDMEHLLTAGFFIDIMPCYLTTKYPSGLKNRYGGINIRLGNKWYFGSSTRFRTGIEATWARFGLFINDITDFGDISAISEGYFSALNIGWANIFTFNEVSGIELNADVGPVIEAFPLGSAQDLALIYGFNAKYRYIRLAVGLDYSRTAYGSNLPKSMISLNIGWKF